MKKIVNGLFKILNIIYSYETNKKINRLKNIIYSYWISQKFNKCESARIVQPAYIRGFQYIDIGNQFSAGKNLKLEAWDKYLNQEYYPRILIGNNVSISSNCHIGSINKIIICDNVLIGSNVFITDHSHGNTDIASLEIEPYKRPLISKGPVVIEKNVWIGENVTILPNVVIGHNSIIGANTVVNKNVPPNCIAVGNPAKIIIKD